MAERPTSRCANADLHEKTVSKTELHGFFGGQFVGRQVGFQPDLCAERRVYNWRVNLTGVFAPVPTPFDEHDAIDLVRMRKALEHWTRELAGVVVLGTTGEFASLDDNESDRVIGTAREFVPSSRLLIAGTTRESTRLALAAARRAAALGVDAVLVRTPSFFAAKMDGDALFCHYRAVADASPVPVLLYNFTAMTGVELEPETVGRLATHPNIVGIKESGGSADRISDLVGVAPPTFAVLAGSASTFHAALRAGACGGILALACLFPEACVRLFTLARSGDSDDARALQERLTLMARLFAGGLGVAGLKAALLLRGIDAGRPRAPLASVSESDIAVLREALANFDASTHEPAA